MEESNLIKKCQRGDKEAFQLLISQYHPFVVKFLVKITNNDQTAEDLTQETFLKVIRNIEKFDTAGQARFSTYVISIAKNAYIDYLRKEKKFMQNIPIHENLNVEDVNIQVENTVVDKLYGQGILANMEDLPEEQRIAIKLKYIEGLTLKEIGDQLNLEPKTVKSRIHNGIVRLRKLLEKGDER
ncbi:RNA polymerase sigma factor SigW [Desulfosporosinus sp. I2]|uniref:RNA polymerase sigma factor n=1 Tax=Desulfosporosinus sp. I2 TaxID=1617025 RepID=UPI0005EF2F06|nr:sigma-70 family RNA polymerase sigma factor [Desulfosporosinus sp. I2]KJR48857.1 RNA polymerase sigma factor SigW [Desulfosporosinus sp. I2]